MLQLLHMSYIPGM